MLRHGELLEAHESRSCYLHDNIRRGRNRVRSTFVISFLLLTISFLPSNSTLLLRVTAIPDVKAAAGLERHESARVFIPAFVSVSRDTSL